MDYYKYNYLLILSFISFKNHTYYEHSFPLLTLDNIDNIISRYKKYEDFKFCIYEIRGVLNEYYL